MSKLVRDSFSRVRCYSAAGDKVEPVYQPEYEKGDCRVLKKVGEQNNYEIIQSFKEECSVRRIVERYRNGDLLALSRVQALYTDTTSMPGSLAQAFDQVKYLNSIFDSLSVESKEFYGDVSGFVSRVLAGDFPKSPDREIEKGGDVNE